MSSPVDPATAAAAAESAAAGNSSFTSAITSITESVSSTVQTLRDSTSSASAPLEAVTSGVNSALEKLDSRRLIGRLFSGSEGGSAASEQASKAVMRSLLLTAENDVFRAFAMASGILGTKLIVNSAWTVYHRVDKKIFSTDEDCIAFAACDEKLSVDKDNATVERIRRMHLNDMENICPFFILGLLYTSTDPNPREAKILFALFTAFRLGHTASYIGFKAQPARFYNFLGGWGCNAFMAYRVLRGYII